MPEHRTVCRNLTVFGSVAWALCAIALSGLMAGPAVGGEIRSDSYAGLTPLAPEELRALRGGISFGGIDFEFGALSTVLLDGTLVAETTFTVAGGGGFVRSLEIFDSDHVSDFDGSDAPAAGLVLGGFAQLPGVVVSDGNGVSVALADISAGRFISALLNNAIGRNIHQRFEATITINNFSQIQASIAASTSIAHIMTGLQTSFALATQ